MLSKAQNKHIRSLTQQKFRDEHAEFVAEGTKIAAEWLASGRLVKRVVATQGWIAENGKMLTGIPHDLVAEVSISEMAQLSQLSTPSDVLLVLPLPAEQSLSSAGGWYLALDGLQDPGNVGTLIRIADWFGIQHVLCMPGCADPFSPKVVQSAMGGHLRVAIHRQVRPQHIEALELPVYAATLHGQDVYDAPRAKSGILVIGNEARGISPEIATMASVTVTIPRKGGAESLNAAVSAGILCACLLPR